MHQGKLVFAQLMAFLPLSTFARCVATHRGDHKVQDFSCLDRFLDMAMASPVRAQAKAATEAVLSRFFTGRIHHHITEAHDLVL